MKNAACAGEVHRSRSGQCFCGSRAVLYRSRAMLYRSRTVLYRSRVTLYRFRAIGKAADLLRSAIASIASADAKQVTGCGTKMRDHGKNPSARQIGGVAKEPSPARRIGRAKVSTVHPMDERYRPYGCCVCVRPTAFLTPGTRPAVIARAHRETLAKRLERWKELLTTRPLAYA